MRRHTFLWLAAALLLASMGAAGAQEAPLFERVRNTLAEIIERRENHPLSERVRNTLAEIIERREKAPACRAGEKHAGRIPVGRLQAQSPETA